MSNRSTALKAIMVIILLEACTLTTPRSDSAPTQQPNSPPQAQDTSQPVATSAPTTPPSSPNPVTVEDLGTARAKIKHVVIIMQENRSFDSYFGTYPGADGIPTSNGKFTVCVNDPAAGNCVYPFHDPADKNQGGPHAAAAATADIDGGKMDGFIGQAEKGIAGCAATNAPNCGGGINVMGYHDAREIPNYWTLAENFVLQDHLFEPNASWSLPAHLFMVSEWSARCSKAGDPMSCINELDTPAGSARLCHEPSS